MIESKVKCFKDINGLVKGRLVNPYNPDPPYNVDDPEDCNRAAQSRIKHSYFERMADQNEHLFPSGTIGKTYERDQVEVVWQYRSPANDQWTDDESRYRPSRKFSTRQTFMVISKTETAQPVEKEPEPLISSRQYIEQVYGTSTFARSIECKDAESLMDMMDDFLDWAMQKKQEASQ